MQYRLVYDVANDGLPWLGLVFVIMPALLAVASFLEIIERVRARRRPPAPGPAKGIAVAPLAVVVGLFLLMASLGVFLASSTYDVFVLRNRCRDWARNREYQVTEGTLTDYHYRKAGPSFRVDGDSFDLLNGAVGFTGRFNVPGTEEDSLRDGLQVRIAHRDGFVLRVEIGSE